MPNHTHVQAFFFGRPEDVARLRRSSREETLFPESALSLHARRALDASVTWPSFAFEPFGSASLPPLLDSSAGLPSTGPDAPFTLRSGVRIPESISRADEARSNLGDFAFDLLRKCGPYSPNRHTPGLSDAPTREKALDWLQANDPAALRDGQRRVENMTLHGASGWYDWSIEHWGTKWDAYEASWSTPFHGGRAIEVRMQTAWSPALPAFSGMCKNFSLGCAALYIDEGGGFADHCLIDAKGEAREARISGSRGARALEILTRRSLRAALTDSGAVAPSAKARKLQAALWPARMALGLELDEASFGAGAPEPGSPLAASLALWACSPGSGLANASAALDELARRGIVLPEQPLEAGYPLGMAFAAAGWAPGLAWSARCGAPELAKPLAFVAMVEAANLNAAEAAAWAWRSLDSSERLASVATLARAPEAALSLAFDAELSAREALAAAARAGLGFIHEPARKNLLLDRLLALDEFLVLDATSVRAPEGRRAPRC